MNPKSIDYFLNRAYHLFPDSKAARGDEKKAATPAEPRTSEPPSADEEASRQQVAFASLMRGIHW